MENDVLATDEGHKHDLKSHRSTTFASPLYLLQEAIVTVTIAPSHSQCEVSLRYCICGKVLLPSKQKGHREREYCSEAYHQRACWARNKQKRELDCIKQEADERL